MKKINQIKKKINELLEMGDKYIIKLEGGEVFLDGNDFFKSFEEAKNQVSYLENKYPKGMWKMYRLSEVLYKEYGTEI